MTLCRLVVALVVALVAGAPEGGSASPAVGGIELVQVPEGCAPVGGVPAYLDGGPDGPLWHHAALAGLLPLTGGDLAKANAALNEWSATAPGKGSFDHVEARLLALHLQAVIAGASGKSTKAAAKRAALLTTYEALSGLARKALHPVVSSAVAQAYVEAAVSEADGILSEPMPIEPLGVKKAFGRTVADLSKVAATLAKVSTMGTPYWSLVSSAKLGALFGSAEEAFGGISFGDGLTGEERAILDAVVTDASALLGTSADDYRLSAIETAVQAGIVTGDASGAFGVMSKGAVGGGILDDYLALVTTVPPSLQPPTATALGLDALPTAAVCHEGFSIGTTEVTVAQFAACVEAGGCLPETFRSVEDDQRCTFGRSGGDTLPMTCVSWAGAEAFAAWVSTTHGVVASLPTEAQWQRAAEQVGEALAVGPGGANLCGLSCPAPWKMTGDDDGAAEIAPVGSPEGGKATDMLGNAAEWCADWYGPLGPVALVESWGSSVKVVRGGSWLDSTEAAGVTARRGAPADLMGPTIGFRLVVTPSGTL